MATGGDGSFWIIVLFLFALMGNWGGNGFGGNGGGGRMPYNDRYSYGNNNMNMGGRGNYAYDNGYSRMSSSDKMMNELQMMMDESTSARDKAIIQRALDELKK